GIRISWKRLDGAAECSRIDGKFAQSSHPKQRSTVSWRHYGTQAGEQVANLGRIHDIESFDREWNIVAGEFVAHIFAMVVDAVKNRDVLPGAARTPAQFEHGRNEVRGFHEGTGDPYGID